MRESRTVVRAIASVAIAFLLLVPLGAAWAGPGHIADGAPVGGQGNPRVFPPNSMPYGSSYGQWAAAHWKWFLSFPAATNPANDFTGASCGEGQSGPVWFLCGSFCPEDQPCSHFTVTRTCTVPEGKSIFLPIVDNECSTVEGNGTTDAELRACAKWGMDLATGIACELDGVPIENIESYRVQSAMFDFGPLPDGNILGAPAGATGASVTDGVFLMFAPLPAGPHTLRFTGAVPYWGFGMDITYNLTVGRGGAGPVAAPSGVTSVRRTTWGQVKTIYR